MKTKRTSESGIFTPRVLTACALGGAAVLFAMLSFASDPPTSTISVPTTIGQQVKVTWTGTIPPLVNGTSNCANLADTALADQHMPTIVVPAGAQKAKFTFNIKWDEAAGNDEILTVLYPNGNVLASSDGGDPTETVTANDLPAGTYKVIACGFISGPAPQNYTGSLTIDTSVAPPAPPLPSPTPAIPGGPRYYNYAPPAAVGENAGEPSIGYNLSSGHAMYIAGLQTLRVSFPEAISPAGSVPAACDAKWDAVSYLV